jgi:hypothetical protein
MIIFILKMWQYVPLKYQFLQEPHGISAQKTTFFIVTAVKTSKLTVLSTDQIFGINQMMEKGVQQDSYRDQGSLRHR